MLSRRRTCQKCWCTNVSSSLMDASSITLVACDLFWFHTSLICRIYLILKLPVLWVASWVWSPFLVCALPLPVTVQSNEGFDVGGWDLANVLSAQDSQHKEWWAFYSLLHDASNELGLPNPPDTLALLCICQVGLRVQHSMERLKVDLGRRNTDLEKRVRSESSA